MRTIFLPVRPPVSFAERDAVKSMRAMAAYMAKLAEQAGFAGRIDMQRLWQNAADAKSREAHQLECATRGRSIIPEPPSPNPVLAILARHGRVGQAGRSARISSTSEMTGH